MVEKRAILMHLLLFLCIVFVDCTTSPAKGLKAIFRQLPIEEPNPKEFLIGLDAPIWTARAPNDFTRLDDEILMESIDEWEKSIQKNQVDRKKHRRDINVKSNKKRDVDALTTNEDATHTTDSTESTIQVVFPTMLIVMSYKNLPDLTYQNPNELKNSIRKMIVYAAAFWQNVNVRLSAINSPRVSLRIAGIVIDTSEKPYGAFPYLDPATYENSDELTGMYEFWRHNVSQLSDAPHPDSYHIVAHMADYEPFQENIDSHPVDIHQDNGATPEVIADIADTKTDRRKFVSPRTWKFSKKLCPPEADGNVIKIRENDYFGGVESAVRKMRVILGDKIVSSEPINPASAHMTWPKIGKSSLSSIQRTLNSTKCYEQPIEYYEPGTPVRTILPGDVYSMDEQCKKKGGYKYQHEIKKEISCRYLECSMSDSVRGDAVETEYIGSVMDGTLCTTDTNDKNRKICIAGKCVKDLWVVKYSFHFSANKFSNLMNSLIDFLTPTKD